MIGQNTLKQYGFNSVNEYFNLIYESLQNGQHQQTKDYIKKLSKSQKKDFMYFFIWDLSNEEMKKGLTQYLIEVILK